MSLLDALLDAIDAKSETVARFADGAVEAMRDEVAAVIAVAARRGSTLASVRKAAGQRLVRAEIVALVELGMQARHLAERVVGDLEDKTTTHRLPRRGPIRAADLEERRTRRPRADAADPPPPALADIAGLSEAQLVKLLRRYGITVDPERMFASTMEKLTEQLIAANVPDDVLIERVATTAERRLRQHMLHEAKAAVREASSQRLAVGRPSGGALLWQAVMDAATCDSCEGRHSETHTHAEWEELGLPGDSALLCDGNCRCELVPVEWVEPGEDITVKVELEITRDARDARDERLVIAGVPRAGKTTLAGVGPEVKHSDDLIDKVGWSEASAEVATWFDAPGPWTIEGVAVGRALRKWLAAHPEGKPCDRAIWMPSPRVPTTRGQDTMGLGCVKVWEEIAPALLRRGVVIETVETEITRDARD